MAEKNWEEIPTAVQLHLSAFMLPYIEKMRREAVSGGERKSLDHFDSVLVRILNFPKDKRVNAITTSFDENPQRWKEYRSKLLKFLQSESLPSLDINTSDAIHNAAAAIVLQEKNRLWFLEVAKSKQEISALKTERNTAQHRIEQLERKLQRVERTLQNTKNELENTRKKGQEALSGLRAQVREQKSHRQETQETTPVDIGAISDEFSEKIAELTKKLEREKQKTALERARAERAEDRAQSARQAAKEARQADEVRLGLLVNTLEGATKGLRQELSLSTHGPKPADVILRAGSVEAGKHPQYSATIDQLLALPQAHLIVDGYNVTKLGYPELPLFNQRDRLTRQLGIISAKNGMEITVVFDGSDVVSAPTTAIRGVRVLFSSKGNSADDVICSLAVAEPAGRPLIVVTSDREIIDTVERSGAHVISSAVLLDYLKT